MTTLCLVLRRLASTGAAIKSRKLVARNSGQACSSHVHVVSRASALGRAATVAGSNCPVAFSQLNARTAGSNSCSYLLKRSSNCHGQCCKRWQFLAPWRAAHWSCFSPTLRVCACDVALLRQSQSPCDKSLLGSRAAELSTSLKRWAFLETSPPIFFA